MDTCLTHQISGNWKDTFQQIPKAIDAAMEKGGAKNFASQGIEDVANCATLIRLPTDAIHRAGDYLTVLPMNPLVTIRRVVKHFGLPQNAIITVKPGQTSLSLCTPLSPYDLLYSYVELSRPATRRVSLFPGRCMQFLSVLNYLLRRT